MNRKAMSLKARVKSIANQKGMSAQVILQNYMFECFLERLLASEFKNKFILKGGMLIASIIGIGNRSTMDMDATVKGFHLTEESLKHAITQICEVKLEDDVIFSLLKIEAIREDDAYGGFRVSIQADYETILIPMSIDITTGDVITPNEITYGYKKLFDDGFINIQAYNIETILAEKFETILRRGELSTRPRDFYDVFILVKTQQVDGVVFNEAIRKTAIHRGTEHIFNDIENRISSIENSQALQLQWKKYGMNYKYASEIAYADVIEAIVSLSLLIK